MGRCTVVVFMLLFVCNMYGQQRFLSNHPRLLFTGAEEAAVKQLIQNNQLAGELAEFLKAKADTLAITPQKPYLKDKYGNILWPSGAKCFRQLGIYLAALSRMTAASFG